MTPTAPALPQTPALRLDGRVALVTGAGRGLGVACAAALGQAGAQVILVSRTAEELEAVATAIRAAGGQASARVCDVTDDGALDALFASIGVLDILVNNAGTNVPQPFAEVPPENLDRMLNLNVRACFRVAQGAVRCMLAHPDRAARGGSVIHMTSQMGHVGAPNRSVYCMTKHALEGLTKAMAVELAPRGIRVNAIAPTFVDTPLTAPMFARPDFRKYVFDRIPAGRLARPEDLMGAVVFLASPASAMVTGTSLVVDGGWTAQ